MGKTFSTGLLTNGIWQDASNNIGIGGSPSGSYKFEVTGTGRFTSGITGANLSLSDTVAITLSATDSRVLGGSSTGRLLLANSGTTTYGIFYGASHATAPNAISLVTDNTERLRITSTGNVGIGTSSPTDYSGYTTLHINGKSGAAGGLLRLTAFNDSSSVNIYAANGINFNTTSAVPFIFLTQDTERMRITSGGNVLVGGTTAGSGNSIALRGDNQGGSGYGYLQVSGSSSITEAMYVYNSTGLVGSIGTNGTAVVFSAGTTERFRLFASGNIRFSSQVYGNTVASPRTLYIQSDGELGGISSIRESKTNIAELDSNWLMQLNPVSFNYRKKDEDGKYTDEYYDELFYGLIAEETELVNKEICTYNDDKLVGIEYSKLVPVLVKAIQELKQELDELKQK